MPNAECRNPVVLFIDKGFYRHREIRLMLESILALHPVYKYLRKEGTGTNLNPKLIIPTYRQSLVRLLSAPGLSQ